MKIIEYLYRCFNNPIKLAGDLVEFFIFFCKTILSILMSEFKSEKIRKLELEKKKKNIIDYRISVSMPTTIYDIPVISSIL